MKSGECLVECSQTRLNTLRLTLKDLTPFQPIGFTPLVRGDLGYVAVVEILTNWLAGWPWILSRSTEILSDFRQDVVGVLVGLNTDTSFGFGQVLKG